MLMKPLRPGRVLWFMRWKLAATALWGLALVAIHTLTYHPSRFGAEPGMLSEVAEALAWGPQGIPFGAIAALGTALAIFLGFRNNGSYDRWWEARKVWGALVNDSRSWCRQVVSWVEAPRRSRSDGVDGSGAEELVDLQKELVHRHLAFVHGLALHLRKDPSLLDTVSGFVAQAEARRYAELPNVPTALLIEQGKCIAKARDEGQIEHFRHLAMDEMLTRLSDIQGKCERIKNTPLPRQYDAFPRWFVYFYIAMLPFGLIEPIGFGAVLVSMGVAVFFLALEGSGRSIENPFEGRPMDTPMTALSVTIERDLRAALGEPLPDAVTPDERGVLS